MVRLGIALAAVGVIGLAGYLVADLRATNDTLRTEKAELTAKVAAVERQRRQILSAERTATQTAAQNAARADALQLQLDAYLNGDCDATDPDCAVAYINRLLGERTEGALP